jgi:hypothetical protein
MVDADASQIAHLARVSSRDGLHVSFAIVHPTEQSADDAQRHGDEAFPRLPDGGLVQWLRTPGELRHMARALGWHHRFLYASSGPGLGQWLLAHGDGGQLIAGAVRINGRADDATSRLRAGDVVELRVQSLTLAVRQLDHLALQIEQAHLRAVPVGRLLHDSGTPV